MRKNTISTLYKSITSATTTTLISKGGTISGDIYKISICNNSANAATGISVHLWSGVGGQPVHPFVHNVTIPSGATLILDDNLDFNKDNFNLIISNAGTAPDLTVIIK
jgi:hypothetical protein